MSSEQEMKPLEAMDDVDKEQKKELVLKTIVEHCTCGETEFVELNAIGARLNKGDTLSCKVISGGKTNYSYKVFFPSDGDKNPVLYAKIAFNYALWSPDRTVEYDLQRTVNEFEIMESFAKAMGGSKSAHVATPYFMVDVEGNAKLFVTEWVATDEQFANQFIDGEVDTRLSKVLVERSLLSTCSLLNRIGMTMYDQRSGICFRRSSKKFWRGSQPFPMSPPMQRSSS